MTRLLALAIFFLRQRGASSTVSITVYEALDRFKYGVREMRDFVHIKISKLFPASLGLQPLKT